MGNICNTCQLFRKKQKNVTVLLLGLDNAGKTTIAKTLVGEPIDSILKTVGFSLVVLHYHGFKITIYDLGGSDNIRDIWNKYYMDAHGLIYVVDASDSARFEESKRVFSDLLSHENISGKHILLLAHKQDKEQAVDELEIVDYLNVEYIVNKYRCPTRVEPSSVIGYGTSKMDKGLKNGFNWLMDNIIRNHKIVNERVQQDMANNALLIEKNREEWRNRMKLESDSPEMTVAENGNPFKPINSIVNEATKKNGTLVRPVLVDNFTEKPKQNSNSSRKTVISNENSLVTAVTQPLEGQKMKLKQRFQKHRKKFGRYNKTAPMSIDMMMRGEPSNVNRNFVSVVQSRAHFTETIVDIPRNYLIRRPATAPPKVNSFRLKVEGAWNLSAPLESSRSERSLDDEDIVSYF